MEPAIKWPHLAICILPSCLVASKAEGVKHSSPFSRFPPSLTPQIICTISSCTEDDTKAPCATPCTHKPDDFPSPLLCLHSTCQPGSSWQMKAQPVLPSDLRSVGCTKPDAAPHSYCSQRKATKSYSLFDPPSTWFSIRSQCQLLPVKR